MTLPIERAATRKPISWLTLIGVLLLPVLIGGILVAALYNPTDRLDHMSAAIVNNDEPVTLDGQLVPLGRQLTAGLVKGSDDFSSNIDWTITNTDDAADGLDDGTYQAVITIPEGFSAAALSPAKEISGSDASARQATIDVKTAPDARVIDDAITAQLSQAAASAMGTSLSSSTMENVFLSFTTLGDKLDEAADGAGTLADGAHKTSKGTQTLADGIRALSSGATTLAGGADGIASGVGALSSGAATLADGADKAAHGLGQWADGADKAAHGLDQWAGGARSAADGLNDWADGASTLADSTKTLADSTTQLADPLDEIAEQLSAAPQIPQEVVEGAHQLADNREQISQGVTDLVTRLKDAAAQCRDQGGSEQLCAALTQAAASAEESLPQLTGVIDQSDQIAKGIDGIAQLPQVGAGLTEIADGMHRVSGGMTKVSGGMSDLADGASDAAGGVSTLADGAQGAASGVDTLAGAARDASTGVSSLATGAQGLADGAGQASSGASQWAQGSRTWATGASESADGADTLGQGVSSLADGADGIASGLHQATDELPRFTDQQAKNLAGVVADPVAASGSGDSLFGSSAIPLLAMIALWFGGLGSFVALRSVTARALASRRSSAALAGRSLLPGALIGAAQGVLVAAIVQIAASYDWGTWSLFAAVCVVAGVAFAAVNQALVAVFGGAGRWIGALVGVVAIATGIISTVPAFLVAVAGVLPTAPALSAGLGALTGAGIGAGVAGLVVWGLLAFVATVIAVMRRRSASVTSLRRSERLA